MRFLVFLSLCLLTHASLADPAGCLRIISALAQNHESLKETRLDNLESKTAQGSLIDIQKALKQKQISDHNQQIRAALKDSVSASKADSVTAINHKDANYLVQFIRKHPTNGEKHEKKYDPEECYGFCFGRATLIHQEALRRNVDPASIRKIWVVGSLEKGKWQFHVASMIKAKGTGSWWVCDPVYSVAISAEEWIRRMRNGSDDNRMMIFVTDPRRFSVYDPQVYTAIDLLGDGKSDFYNGYFKDYLEHLQTEPTPKPFRN